MFFALLVFLFFGSRSHASPKQRVDAKQFFYGYNDNRSFTQVGGRGSISEVVGYNLLKVWCWNVGGRRYSGRTLFQTVPWRQWFGKGSSNTVINCKLYDV